MNGQSRGTPTDYSNINPIKQIKVLENYRGYKKIIFLRPFPNTYMGYLDDDFFGFTVNEEGNFKGWLMEPKEAVDHYLDKTFFHIPSVEYNAFAVKPEYKVFLNALKVYRENEIS